MDNDSRPEATTGHEDVEITPEEERELVAFLRDPHLFQDLIDDLDLTPPVYMLMWWGTAHGVYRARAIPEWSPLALSEEELWAWHRRWEEKRRARRPKNWNESGGPLRRQPRLTAPWP